MTHLLEQKNQLRKSIRHKRKTHTEAELLTFASELKSTLISSDVYASLPKKAKIGIYFSYQFEPPTHVILNELHKLKNHIYLPRCLNDNTLGWSPWSPESLMGMSKFTVVPESQNEIFPSSFISDLDILFIPALAIDSSGTRLGQGGGYYDRSLSVLKLKATKIVAIIFDNEFNLTHQLPSDSFDVKVTHVLTPTKMHKISSILR